MRLCACEREHGQPRVRGPIAMRSPPVESGGERARAASWARQCAGVPREVEVYPTGGLCAAQVGHLRRRRRRRAGPASLVVPSAVDDRRATVTVRGEAAGNLTPPTRRNDVVAPRRGRPCGDDGPGRRLIGDGARGRRQRGQSVHGDGCFQKLLRRPVRSTSSRSQVGGQRRRAQRGPLSGVSSCVGVGRTRNAL